MLVEELKPFIDSRYRTLPGAENTGLGGSSLGGLLSLYVGLLYQDVFAKLAVMSPSVWWDDRAILSILRASDVQRRARIWLDIGTAEGSNPAQMTEDARRLRDLLLGKGWREGVDLTYCEADGAGHNEREWAKRVGPMLRYLFPGRVNPGSERQFWRPPPSPTRA
jgi:predicted alpha/beta superfamily hydrolase